MLEAITPSTRLVFVPNPNNPTGTIIPQADIDRFMEKVPDHVVTVFDEAYYEFLDEPPDTLRYVRENRNVVVLRTFSKIHGLAGLRIGYGIAAAPIIALMTFPCIRRRSRPTSLRLRHSPRRPHS